jgi:protein involved in polysaccharide export with SLBB domain
MTSTLIITICWVFLVFPVFAQIQTGSNQTTSRQASKYTLAPGMDALMMQIKIWGEVRNPGIYEVPTDTDLIALISSAGGPTTQARLDKIEIIRYDPKYGGERVVYFNLEKFLETGSPEGMPEMQANDIIIVPSRFSKLFFETASYLSTITGIVAAVALIVERLERAGYLKK